MHTLLAREWNARNHALLRLLYGAGLRVSEACALCWRDLQPRGTAGQVTVYGKGGKTRAVLFAAEMWEELDRLRQGAGPDAPVFISRKGVLVLTRRQATRIVTVAPVRAGITSGVSPHWLRHAHVSHAFDRGGAYQPGAEYAWICLGADDRPLFLRAADGNCCNTDKKLGPPIGGPAP